MRVREFNALRILPSVELFGVPVFISLTQCVGGGGRGGGGWVSRQSR